MTDSASKIPAPARRTGVWLAVATLAVVLGLYFSGNTEISKYVLIAGGGLAIVGSLLFTSLRLK